MRLSKSLRKLGLHYGKRAGRPVENLVELKTVFEMAFGEDRAVGFEGIELPPLRP